MDFQRFTKFFFSSLLLLVCNNTQAQPCSGSWAVQRPINVDCFSGQYVGQVSGNPVGCPINPIYTSVQTNTFTFVNPVSTFSIDFRSFDGAINCPRLEIKINGLFYPLSDLNLTDLEAGPTCGGSFSAVQITSDGFITTASTLSSRGRITMTNVNAGSITISSNDVNGTAFTTPFGCTVLPLQLINFFGGPTSNCRALISWKSGIESNVQRIELTRSIDGINFNKVAEVESLGNVSHYEVETDNREDAFFRLKIIDMDGSFTYSEIIRVRAACAASYYSISPNPVSSFAEIKGTQKNDLIYIKNSIGQTMLSFKALTNTSRFDLSQLSPGAYFVQIQSVKGSKSNLKIIKF